MASILARPQSVNNTAAGKQGAGEYLIFPDVSSTFHSQYKWFSVSEFYIYLLSYVNTQFNV